MKLFFLLSILFFGAVLTSGQQVLKDIQDLEQQLKGKKGTERIEILKEIAWLYLKVEPKRTRKIADSVLAEIPKEDNSKIKATMLNISGIAATTLGYFDIAVEKHLQSLKIREFHNDSAAIAASLNNIGLVYKALENYEEAINYFNKSLEYKYKSGDTNSIVISLNNAASAYLELKKYNKTNSLLQQALSLNTKDGSRESLSLTLSNMGRYYYKKLDYDSALYYARAALEVRAEIDNTFGIMEQYLEIGKIYLKLKDFEPAEKNLKIAMNMALAGPYPPILKEIYLRLYLLYNALDIDKLTLDYYRKYHAIREWLKRTTLENRIEELKLQYDQEKNLAKIQQLELDKQDALLNYSLIIVFILIVFGGVVFNRYRYASRINRELHEREGFNNALLASLPEYVLVLFQGKMVYANNILKDTIGISGKDLSQINILDYIEEQYNPLITANLQQKFAGEDPREYEAALRSKDGLLRIVSIRSAIVPYHDSKAVLIVMNDITERTRAEKEIINAKEKAERSDRLKSEFLAQVSHEIRTPLHVMLSWSSLLQEDLLEKVSEELTGGFDVIKNQGQRTIRTIDLILNMSELQLGTYEVYPREIDIHKEVILKLYGEFNSRAKQKKLSFNLFIQTDQTSTVADEYSISQIFLNLIENAIKYTDAGNINIIIGRDVNDKLFVTVSDTGIGISEDYMPRLFEPFSQEQQGYSRKFEGNGLGLALVKKYCELNDLDVSVISEKGKGSDFTILFNKS